MNPTHDRLVRFLGVTRAAAGFGILVRPRLVYRCLGVGAADDGDAVARLFAIREVAVAASALQSDPMGRQFGVATGIFVDSVDVISLVFGSRHGAGKGALVIGGIAAIYAVAGSFALLG
ncbi:hypothetical protein [Smaragdicoccus niigatensis]|uniref:hypothetical protein n=1 Tax=Smaragdicoccus niigatensis TaxID=359359 RepID=UPI000378CF9D|nr:hypothetical protein [Smaragdicoccus niigatensis]